MNLNLRTRLLAAELTVESGSTKITEDVTVYNSQEKQWLIPESEIEQFITVANEMSRFNKVSDLDFCKMIIDAFLNEDERAELIEHYTQLEIGNTYSPESVWGCYKCGQKDIPGTHVTYEETHVNCGGNCY